MKEYIEDKRDKLEDLYSRLYADSGYQAKIYVLGYPKFISDDFASHCSLNPASVSSAEREFIGHGIEYMNNVIESAAKKAGVAYVDTEDNLRSHRLCDDDDSYVTGVAAWRTSEIQESFHPNHNGHRLLYENMMKGILNQTSLVDYDNCPNTEDIICPVGAEPGVSEYFSSEKKSVRYAYNPRMVQGDIIRGNRVAVAIDEGLAPFSNATITIHSTPQRLGDYIVDGGGSVVASVVLPQGLEPGYHTITVEGVDGAQQQVEYSQAILVRASLTDSDGDGIDDAHDRSFNDASVDNFVFDKQQTKKTPRSIRKNTDRKPTLETSNMNKNTIHPEGISKSMKRQTENQNQTSGNNAPLSGWWIIAIGLILLSSLGAIIVLWRR